MNRSICLAAIVIMLTSVTGMAQMGGMGGMGMGRQGMMMGGGMMPSGPTEVRRTAQVEMEGGQRLSGQIDLRPLTVQGDVGSICHQARQDQDDPVPETDERGPGGQRSRSRRRESASGCGSRCRPRTAIRLAADPAESSARPILWWTH